MDHMKPLSKEEWDAMTEEQKKERSEKIKEELHNAMVALCDAITEYDEAQQRKRRNLICMILATLGIVVLAVTLT